MFNLPEGNGYIDGTLIRRQPTAAGSRVLQASALEAGLSQGDNPGIYSWHMNPHCLDRLPKNI